MSKLIPIELCGEMHALLPQSCEPCGGQFTREQLLGWRFFASRDSGGFIEWDFEWGNSLKGMRVDLALHGPEASQKGRHPKEARFVCAAIKRNGLKFRQYQLWRDVEPKVGHLRGLPSSHGRLVATDGVRCIVEREGQACIIGHLENFVEKKSASTTRGRHLLPLPVGFHV